MEHTRWVNLAEKWFRGHNKFNDVWMQVTGRSATFEVDRGIIPAVDDGQSGGGGNYFTLSVADKHGRMQFVFRLTKYCDNPTTILVLPERSLPSYEFSILVRGFVNDVAGTPLSIQYLDTVPTRR